VRGRARMRMGRPARIAMSVPSAIVPVMAPIRWLPRVRICRIKSAPASEAASGEDVLSLSFFRFQKANI
jgi:hypothetical protein